MKIQSVTPDIRNLLKLKRIDMVKDINIELSGIKKSYDKPVLKDICLSVTNYSYVTIVGKSGSGKSTLMNILGLIEGFDGGVYRFNNTVIKKGKDYSKLRYENIGFIFQSYNLIPTLTCRENIMLPLVYSSKQSGSFDEIIESLDIADLLDKKVTVLSGGEKQRVAIARALLLNPSLIIADEPTGNLDPTNTRTVLNLLEKENKKGRAVIMITHDDTIAREAGKVYRLENGVLHENY